MKFIIGAIVIIFGVLLGLYLGGYICLYGGIIELVESAKMTPIDAPGIAFGIIRILGAAIVGWGSFFLVAMCGGGIMSMKSKPKSGSIRGPWNRY